jgi:hypothetical protein
MCILTGTVTLKMKKMNGRKMRRRSRRRMMMRKRMRIRIIAKNLRQLARKTW